MAQKLHLLRFAWLTAGLLCLASLGGWLGWRVGLPLPWMLGSLLAVSVLVLAGPPGPLKSYVFPNSYRQIFIALIGVMIGSQVTREILAQAMVLPLAAAAVLVFILLALLGNYWLFRRVGGYDRATAFYSSSPGGLIESIALGESAGADIRVLTLQQFLRIILVITLVPSGLSIWAGEPLGSAAGLTGPAGAPVGVGSLVLILVTAALGLGLGHALRFPAPQLSGAMLLTAGITLSGVLDLHLPFWLLAVAQVVIGMTLGLRFNGVSIEMLRRCAWMALLSVSYMISLGGLIAVLIWLVTDIPFLALLLSFSPGGVTEMSLVALSLSVSPALVSLLHILRIVLTVSLLGGIARRMGLA